MFPQYAPNSKLEEYWRIDRHKLAAVSLLMGEPQGGSAVVLRLTAILPLVFTALNMAAVSHPDISGPKEAQFRLVG